MNFSIEIEREDDGRWIAEIPELPGVLAYGNTEEEAKASVEALALHVVADRIDSSKQSLDRVSFAVA
jgi:predicted RNase H-like HicB family nuclease